MDSIVYDIGINLKIMMGDFVTHFHDAFPINLRIFGQKFLLRNFIKTFYGFANGN